MNPITRPPKDPGASDQKSVDDELRLGTAPPNEQHADHRNEKTPHHRHSPPLPPEHQTSNVPYPSNESRLAHSTFDHSDLSMRSAPIVPDFEQGVDDARNGLPLCPTHHRAFDRGYLLIDPANYSFTSSDGGPSVAELGVSKTDLGWLPAFPHHLALEWH